MIELKELTVVLAIAAAVFGVAKPVALLFSPKADFLRRRNVWFALTIAAFLSPKFLYFAIFAVPVLLWAGRRDSNPSALYLLLLQVIPSILIPIPMVGLSYLFNIDNYALLSLCVMTPAALTLIRSKKQQRLRGMRAMDLWLVAYGVLTAVFYVHAQAGIGAVIPSTPTDDMRRLFLFFLTSIIPYFVISRSCSGRREIVDMIGSFCLLCTLMAAIAIFEDLRHWLLYADLANHWGYPIDFSLYLVRDSNVRAMASADHPLGLGYMLVMGIGFWLCLKDRVNSVWPRLTVQVLLWLGLLVTYSRGPWIGGVFIYLSYAMLRPRGSVRLLKAASAAAMVAVVIYISPLGDKIFDVLPFFGGTIDVQTLTYREKLWRRAWEIIIASPLFGDPGALLKMQDLRQGQGIIDIVNSYLEVLLNCGFVGLAMFLSFILTGFCKAYFWGRRAMKLDPSFGLLGVGLGACILATLLLLQDGSFTGSIERMFYVLGGMAAGYAYLGSSFCREKVRHVDSRPIVVGRNRRGAV